jgi:uncharacterized protein YndB with AHSA1/START domain
LSVAGWGQYDDREEVEVDREFEFGNEITVAATPEQVWNAIATGPGIDSWFMGRTEVGTGEGGAVRTEFGGLALSSTVTGWEPPHRFAHSRDVADDGRFIAYEFLIEGRARGSTVMRLVTSGFLPGDDWEAEYDAITKGIHLFVRTLAEYLTHFPGRSATPVTAFGPAVSDWDRAWASLSAALGLEGQATEGGHVRFTGHGGPPVDGVVYVVNPHAVGVRAHDGLYRFLRGLRGSMIAAHHLFSDVDPRPAERAWTAWLDRVVA